MIRKPHLRALFGPLLLSVLAASACSNGPPTEPGGPTLVPLHSRIFGFESVVPQGWILLKPEWYTPSLSATEQTVLVFESFPGMALAEARSWLPGMLGLQSLPTGTSHVSAALTWDVMTFNRQVSGGTLTVGIALAASGSAVYMVGLKAWQSDFERLSGEVLVPALDSLHAIATDPYGSAGYASANASLFDYDAGAALDIQEGAAPVQGTGYTVRDISYASPKGGRVPAYLVVPDGAGPFAGIVMMHGSGANRGNLLGQAIAYARTGAVVILPTAPHSRPGVTHGELAMVADVDRAEQIQLNVDLRRAVDLLVARADVDAQRLGFVGHSFGAAQGALLAGIEDRIKAYALMSGNGGWVEFHSGLYGPISYTPVVGVTTEALQALQQWVTGMWPIEPIHFIPNAAPASLLFQIGMQDANIPRSDLRRLYFAASAPKQLVEYQGVHWLPDAAWTDQALWFQQKIGINATAFHLRAEARPF